MTADQSLAASRTRAKSIALGVVDLARPPRRVKVSESVAESMYVVHGNGTKTLWSASKTPYMLEPMDAMGSRLFDSVIFVGPARTGKTLGLIDGFVSYKLLNDPGDGLITQITEEKAREYSKKRLDRTFHSSPDLAEKLSPRGHDNNVHDKIFNAGSYLAIKWPSKNVFASSDYQYVLLTDYDRMPQDIGGEGSAFQLASKRTQTFGSTGMTLAESSPGRPVLDSDWRKEAGQPHKAPPTTGIMDLYNQGDRRRLYWQCPQKRCRAWFQPVQENFNLQTGLVFCPVCAVELQHKDKKNLNLFSRWVPEGCELDDRGVIHGSRRPGRSATFWMEGPAAAYQTWQSLTQKLQAAERTFQEIGDQEDLKAVTNTDWGRPYLNRVTATSRSSLDLMERSEDIKRRTVSAGVRFLVATVDVQGGKNRRFVVQVHGFGPGKETWIVDRFNIKDDRGPGNDQEPRQISPATQPEDWDILTRDVLKRSYKLAGGSGIRMPIATLAVDTGGEGAGAESVTSQAYDWFRRLKAEGMQDRVFLVKGGSSRTANRVSKTWPDNTGRKSRKSRARGDVPLYILGTDLLKDAVAGMMDRDNPGAGYIHTPSWLGRWWFDELTYEVKDSSSGKWSKPGKRANEALDLMAYALACLVVMGYEKINWKNPPPWAADWEFNALLIRPEGQAKGAAPGGQHKPPLKRKRPRVVKSKL